MPTVLDSVIGRVKPGRTEDHLAMGVEVVKLFDRLGAKNPRLAMATAATTIRKKSDVIWVCSLSSCAS